MAQGTAKNIATLVGVEDGGTEEGWDFDLGEHVRLLWTPNTGQVIGRTEYIHRDVQYLVEYTNADGRLVAQWIYGDAIDHLVVN